MEDLTPSVRLLLSKRFIETVVNTIGTQEIFHQSKGWAGYERAYDSWLSAYWSWVDRKTPRGGLENWKLDESRLLAADADKMARDRGLSRSELPSSENERKYFMAEYDRNYHLHRVASCALDMCRPGPLMPELHGEFTVDFQFAKKLGDKSYDFLFTRNAQRKSPIGKGDRLLKYRLLWYWIPACLWAITTDGILAFLDRHWPKLATEGEKQLYNPTTVADAWREFKLYRLRRPMWWGLSGDPAKMEPLK